MFDPVSPAREDSAVVSIAKRAAAVLFALLLAERERWILWTPVGLGLGVAVYFSLPAEPPFWGGPALLASGGLFAWSLRRRTGALLLMSLVLIPLTGFSAAQLRTTLVYAPVLEREVGPVDVVGRVVAVEPRNGGERLLLDRLQIEDLAPSQTPARIRLTVAGGAPSLLPGQEVRALAGLRPPPEPVAPGAFDFARQAYFEELGAVGFTYGGVEMAPTTAQGSFAPLDAWRLFWSAARSTVSARIAAVLDGDVGAVAMALTTGHRGEISEETLGEIRDSGLAHLLAISGLHIGLVTAIVFYSLRLALAAWPRVALYHPIKKWAALASAVAAFCYLMLAGATFPTQRAFLMTLVVLVAIWIDRVAISQRLVAFAATVILLLRPEALLSASFQLSFAAVTALVAAYEWRRGVPLSERIGERGMAQRAALYLLAVLLTSLIATLATTPFAVQHFNRLAWLGIAANLGAVPLTAFWIMPWGLLSFLLMPFGLEALALVPMGWGIAAMLALAAEVASWPSAVVLLPAMPMAGFAAAVLGGLWLCLWQRPWRLLGLAALALGLASITLAERPDVLIAGDGRLIGVRQPDGALALSSQTRGRFAADIWRHRLAASDNSDWPGHAGASDDAGASEDAGAGDDTAETGEPMACDPLACVLERSGVSLALVTHPSALVEECRRADVVVSLEPLRGLPCPSAEVVVDRFDLWRMGAHSLRITPDGEIELRSVRARRGERPWVRRPED